MEFLAPPMDDCVRSAWTSPHCGGLTLRRMSDTSDLIGRIFDKRYEIIELIGRGGMSTVYRAIQLSMQKPVALKVMTRSLSDDKNQLQRFNQEALASSRLRHPNTIKVFDYGRSEDGYLFLAMEFLEGRTLAHVIKHEGRVPPLRACAIARQTCKSLAEAHRSGIIHRDLKPENIFLTDIHGEVDFVKVLDFGIAKFIADGAPQETLTQTGFICGTPLYLSPEQGLDRELTRRTDLYSLGIILYEMVVGDVPFKADTPIGVVMKHIHDPVPNIRQRLGHTAIPERLEQLIYALLQKDPALRPDSSETVVQVLDSVLYSDEFARYGGESAYRAPIAEESDDDARTRVVTAQAIHGAVVSMPSNERPTLFLSVDSLRLNEPTASRDDEEDKTIVQNRFHDAALMEDLRTSYNEQLHGEIEADDPTVMHRVPHWHLGSAQSEFPDESVDSTSVPVYHGRSTSVRWLWLALGVLLLSAGGTALWLWQGGNFGTPASPTGAKMVGGRLVEPVTISIRLPKRLTNIRVITVLSVPDGEVYQGGERLGPTPYSVEIGDGERARELEVRSAGHHSEKVLIDPKVFSSTSVKLLLRPDESGAASPERPQSGDSKHKVAADDLAGTRSKDIAKDMDGVGAVSDVVEPKPKKIRKKTTSPDADLQWKSIE